MLHHDVEFYLHYTQINGTWIMDFRAEVITVGHCRLATVGGINCEK